MPGRAGRAGQPGQPGQMRRAWELPEAAEISAAKFQQL